MGRNQIILAVACLSALIIGIEGSTSTQGERFEAIEAEIEQLRNDKDSEINLLKSKISDLETELQLMDSSTVFDCYLSKIWDIHGTIQFDGCDGKHEIRK